jgi:soluble lytic murein transglycosylase-like protein
VRLVSVIVGIIAMAVSNVSSAYCWQDAGAKYNISPVLLYAIAKHESGLHANLISSLNSDGTYDIGLMQINSRHLPVLAQYGITEKSLLNGCLSAHIAAWLLADNFRRMGNNWNAVGAYNAKTTWRRANYAWAIHNTIYGADKIKEKK